jgi:hypothetical protein
MGIGRSGYAKTQAARRTHQRAARRRGLSMARNDADMSSPDTWTEPDWRDFQWFGVCECGI